MRGLEFVGSGLRRSWIAAALALVSAGCETQPPPSLANRAKTTAASSGQGMKSLEVALDPNSPTEVEVLKVAARTQAGLDTVRVQFAEAAGGQAVAVREAIARKPPAIIIEAPETTDPELVKAVAEAKAKGILVVAVGRPLGGEGASAEGSGREVVVAPRPFAESAPELVKLAARNAVNGKLDPKAGALVVSRPAVDPLVADRAAALKKALADFGVAEVDEFRYEGDLAAGKAAILERLAAHPKATMVLAADSVSLAAAQGAVRRERRYSIAGYSGDESVVRSMIKTGEYAGVGLFFMDRILRKGINVAVHVLRGDKVSDRVGVDIEIVSSGLQTGLPQGPPDDDSKTKKPFEAE
ncbi:sugar ABC transporter substrate-binding protein [Paludisphaera rhizosphaerae]|uniref:sugar ABC transporter substrate-binding protein n=1 Tax=Paludisphaera rhizosphaerae TaxID=2711216 RepID=UPI0013EC8448|nr:substrate-binding domain-containing protein [Paludisphaera rhizosphaerae]